MPRALNFEPEQLHFSSKTSYLNLEAGVAHMLRNEVFGK